MEAREHSQEPERLPEARRAEDGVGDGGETAEAEKRQSELLRRKVELQHRIQNLRDEENVLQHEKTVRSLAKAKEKKLATAAAQKQSNKQIRSRKPPKRHPPDQKKSSLGAESANAGITNTGNDGGDATAGGRRVSKSDSGTLRASLRPIPSFRQGGFTGERPGQGQKSSVLADMAAVEGSVESGNFPNVIPAPPYPRCSSDDAIEEERSVKEENHVLDVDFLWIIRSARLHECGGEVQVEAAHRARRERMQATENRQQRSLRRLNLVDEMFSKALERRMRAMQRIAADPPADRLIGNHVVQHIPVSMLPGQLKQTALTLMAGSTGEGVQSPSSAPSPTGAIKDAPGGRVFLTAVDMAAAEKQITAPTDAPDAEDASQQAEGKTTTSPRVNDIDEDKLLREWRELGYTAVYLPATRRLVYPDADCPITRNTKRPYSPNACMQKYMQPLPSVHLVQRQLPPEAILAHKRAKSTGRRRLLPFISVARNK
ncbi:hypothetical protein TraAM80_02403 [Trypanosoma rangeli]|uniref:Uncharacterized protein n=1 Tax=Trypanosoma rangeli TaxID=5698 RepID=A0A422NUM0_TRYRA|nr:uncharacterized protein TraAM80_02403 [Trypanosoma rangeli]RNF09144.1 hypothetical protein TraAM80_02403 [Trypanosoma rangeli]|eukprot:RNF09144.1 hypothetical protein TraAM80_02403 [Trypanosoma rangeli]